MNAPKRDIPQIPTRRKPYRTPSLVCYGAIRTITANIGAMTLADNGTTPKVKTA
ncbi:MAG: hypothetical protein ABI789_15445 [Usitatibacter sp.]